MKYREDTVSALVINCMRPLTGTAEDILDLARRIEGRGRLKTDLLINNTNLADQTTPEMIEQGEHIVLECARELGISRVCTTGKGEILRRSSLHTPVIPVRRYMVPEWMEEQE
jgi:hypothetical protein